MKIRSEILRLYRTVHTWAGIGAGMLLFIGFFGGALTMFKEPLERWASPPPAIPATVPAPARLDALVRDVVRDHPAARAGFTVHLKPTERDAAPVSWHEGEDGNDALLAAPRWLADAGPDGTVVRRQQPTMLAELIDMLHRTGGIPGTLGDEYAGVYVMGVAAVLYFLALVSGVVLLLPTLVKDFFAVRRGKNRKRFWLDVHNVLGIASLPFHIVISLTAIVFAFHDQAYGALRGVVYGSQPLFAHPHPGTAPQPVERLLAPSALAERVRRAAPGAEPAELTYMDLEGPRPLVRAAIDSPRDIVQGARHGYVIVEPYTGAVLDTSMVPGRRGTYSALVTSFFTLHFGSYGGLLTRWAYFVSGLAGAVLFYTGNLLWIEKRRKQQLRNGALPAQTRNTYLVAAATVGVCLGSVAGVGAALAAGKWLHAAGIDANAGSMAVYYAVFLGCVGWAFVLGAARAAGHLLGLCAALALALPATSLCAHLLPGLGVWPAASGPALGVDAVALLAALLLAWGARRAARRARTGPADSVWSAGAAAPQPAEALPENVA
jgi:uncharacterized iron-regulated membrane protein